MNATIAKSHKQTFQHRFSKLNPEQLLRWADREFGDQLAMSTSFGIQSSVMLHLATQVRPNMPVIWVDTGYLPEETYAYATTLTRLLDLNLHVYESPLSPAEMEIKYGKLWESEDVEDLDTYDQIRKVEPMQRALDDLDVRGWISGLRAQQTDHRQGLSPVRKAGSRYRLHPILEWTSRDIYRYMQNHNLPQHPLFFRGYTTVGDAHSSRPLSVNDSHERDTRFAGKKQECGLHL